MWVFAQKLIRARGIMEHRVHPVYPKQQVVMLLDKFHGLIRVATSRNCLGIGSCIEYTLSMRQHAYAHSITHVEVIHVPQVHTIDSLVFVHTIYVLCQTTFIDSSSAGVIMQQLSIYIVMILCVYWGHHVLQGLYLYASYVLYWVCIHCILIR